MVISEKTVNKYPILNSCDLLGGGVAEPWLIRITKKLVVW